MKTIPFVKYTSFGNNFVIVDETNHAVLDEKEKSAFAYQATNMNFGVGADNFLVVQPANPDVYSQINGARNYWTSETSHSMADYVFRMFEPDGTEAYCCANGLMCVAQYLYRQYGLKTVNIETEIPTSTPKTVSMGICPGQEDTWINLGHPRKIPDSLVRFQDKRPYDKHIDKIERIRIPFRKHDLSPFSSDQHLTLSGYLVFTGEPHMVVFIENGISLEEVSKLIFIKSQNSGLKFGDMEKRAGFGNWLVKHIGRHLNREMHHVFPEGININFARVDAPARSIEYRCYERGICKETLSCGTGALAVAYVADRLGFSKDQTVAVWPHRCRWYQSSSRIVVQKGKGGWVLRGRPQMLFSGKYLLEEKNQPQRWIHRNERMMVA